jgi:uncharacterized protein (DUF488 family)
VEVYSVGFTNKTADQFFGLLKSAGIRRLLDIRPNNVSQLVGFANRKDLQYFPREICGAEYVHEALLATTNEILDDYKQRRGGWEAHVHRFRALMADRCSEEKLEPSALAVPTALLCSEPPRLIDADD